MRRISCTDQRISAGVAVSAFFLGRRLVRVVTDHRHHGERQHDERHVTMPAVPGAGLVVVEPEFVLGGLKAVLDRPAMPFDPDQGFDARTRRTPSDKERKVAIGDGTAHQKAARP